MEGIGTRTLQCPDVLAAAVVDRIVGQLPFLVQEFREQRVRRGRNSGEQGEDGHLDALRGQLEESASGGQHGVVEMG